MPSPVNQSAGQRVDGTWRRLGSLLWPARCLACGEAGDDHDLCAPCRAALPWHRNACLRCALPLPAMAGGAAATAACGRCLRHPPPLDRVQAACLYAAPLDRWLPRFKFHQDLAAGHLLAQLLAQACADAPRPQAVVPVPLHRARLRRRGYDQALELARPLARALALPLQPRLLQRVRATAPQSELSAAARRRNLRDAFVVAANAALPAHVVLVDDVMTTGATLHAAARALRRAGVARVDAWVCARVP
ncbi:ComF family protein [Luteimonas sp. 50]|uniref:ComF family protein n=1 Tax=Cognatiluteimonas sedimenti TaxID=2927791 RepID=A0ABT0A5T7_9GAMM|nr:ComF family protein [Lysobacter sedimenti]MCJ0826337.1 ComF family protein [Lysobacter sedimenti]